MADLEQLLKQSQELKEMLKKLADKANKLEKEIAGAKERQAETDRRSKSHER
jgi:prefoldin subunit 5